MEAKCPDCGHQFETEVAPELKSACPRCMAEFLLSEDTATESVPPEAVNTEEPPPLQPGAKLRGYEVIELLGRGGMAFVYRAKQTELDRMVALKILAPRLAASPGFAARFDREAKALASLNHPNIVQVHDCGREGELFFLVMELVNGTSLRQILAAQRLTPETALRYVPQVCAALEYAHSVGIVHRDIKPDNILIDRQGNLKIADFGLAKIAQDASGGRDRQTLTGQVLGTPHYMAPEQVENTASVDHRADVYSLGVVFYEMLTGELPLGRFPPPSRKVSVDVRFDEVVLKALEKEPERRYQTANLMKEDLTGLRKPDGQHSDKATAARASEKPSEKHRIERRKVVRRARPPRQRVWASGEKSKEGTSRAIKYSAWSAILILLFAAVLVALAPRLYGNRLEKELIRSGYNQILALEGFSRQVYESFMEANASPSHRVRPLEYISQGQGKRQHEYLRRVVDGDQRILDAAILFSFNPVDPDPGPTTRLMMVSDTRSFAPARKLIEINVQDVDPRVEAWRGDSNMGEGTERVLFFRLPIKMTQRKYMATVNLVISRGEIDTEVRGLTWMILIGSAILLAVGIVCSYLLGSIIDTEPENEEARPQSGDPHNRTGEANSEQ